MERREEPSLRWGEWLDLKKMIWGEEVGGGSSPQTSRWKHGVLRHMKRIRAEAAGELERN